MISEVLADNRTAVLHDGHFPDWVEIRNGSATTTNLSGWTLTDRSGGNAFTFPSGTTILPGGYVVVWLDPLATSGLRANFALNRDGDGVFLYDATGGRVDAVGFGRQAGDYSLACIGDAWKLAFPTPAAAN